MRVISIKILRYELQFILKLPGLRTMRTSANLALCDYCGAVVDAGYKEKHIDFHAAVESGTWVRR